MFTYSCEPCETTIETAYRLGEAAVCSECESVLFEQRAIQAAMVVDPCSVKTRVDGCGAFCTHGQHHVKWRGFQKKKKKKLTSHKGGIAWTL